MASKVLSNFQKGKLAELYFEVECIKQRIEISRPVLDARYDYVAFIDGVARRAQVKWADRRVGGCVEVALHRPRGYRNGKTRIACYSATEIDLVFAYLPAIEKFVVFGPELFHMKVSLCFRVQPAKNGQKLNIRNASDFLWPRSSTG